MSSELILGVLTIIYVNFILSGDNAVVIALAVRSLPPKQQKLGIFWGSFAAVALRIALRQSFSPISNLKEVFCISPALDPYKSTLAIDSGFPAYRHYFLAKWKRSLRKKQHFFPELYHFGDILHHNTCLALTEAIMPYYPEFGNYRDYFRQYTLTGEVLASLAMPVTIFTSEDDPVVASEDFHQLPSNPYLQLSVQKSGGHCGFLDPFPWGCWYERRIAYIMEQKAQA